MRKYPYVPQPMVLRVSLQENREITEGEPCEFGVRLFGPAIDFYPYVIVAVDRMCQKGLGQDRIPVTIERVNDGFQTIYESGAEHALHPPSQRTIAPSDAHEQGPVILTFNIITPMRIRTNGQLNPLPTAEALVKAAIRRLRVMGHFYGEGEIAPDDVGTLIEASVRAKVAQKDLRWHQIPRRSKRQGVDMVLDGVVGQVRYEAPDPSFIRWLVAAQECHIGKATSFGFGRYSCEVTN